MHSGGSSSISAARSRKVCFASASQMRAATGTSVSNSSTLIDRSAISEENATAASMKRSVAPDCGEAVASTRFSVQPPRILIVPLHQLARRHRLGDPVALREIASEVAEHFPCRLVFDAFGTDLFAEVVREVDDGADDRGVGVADRHLSDERFVDLDLVDRQL